MTNGALKPSEIISFSSDYPGVHYGRWSWVSAPADKPAAKNSLLFKLAHSLCLVHKVEVQALSEVTHFLSCRYTIRSNMLYVGHGSDCLERCRPDL